MVTFSTVSKVTSKVKWSLRTEVKLVDILVTMNFVLLHKINIKHNTYGQNRIKYIYNYIIMYSGLMVSISPSIELILRK